MRDAAFPRGKLACDSPWPLGLSTSVPLVPAHVLLFFFPLGDSSAEAPWKLASVSRSPDFTPQRSEEARTLPRF